MTASPHKPHSYYMYISVTIDSVCLFQEYKKAVDQADEKVQLANQIHDLVCSYFFLLQINFTHLTDLKASCLCVIELSYPDICAIYCPRRLTDISES